MIERFLQYSRDHQRRIQLMIQDEKGIRRLNVTILRFDKDTVFFHSSRSKKEQEMPFSRILAANYARGDDGDTLKNG